MSKTPEFDKLSNQIDFFYDYLLPHNIGAVLFLLAAFLGFGVMIYSKQRKWKVIGASIFVISLTVYFAFQSMVISMQG